MCIEESGIAKKSATHCQQLSLPLYLVTNIEFYDY